MKRNEIDKTKTKRKKTQQITIKALQQQFMHKKLKKFTIQSIQK